MCNRCWLYLEIPAKYEYYLKQEGFVIRLERSVVLARLPVDFGFWSVYRNVPGECVFYFRGTGEGLGFRQAFSGISGLFVLSEDSW